MDKCRKVVETYSLSLESQIGNLTLPNSEDFHTYPIARPVWTSPLYFFTLPVNYVLGLLG